MRRTKIVATLGPASDDPEVLTDLLSAGVDVVRLGLAHGATAPQTDLANLRKPRCRIADAGIGALHRASIAIEIGQHPVPG